MNGDSVTFRAPLCFRAPLLSALALSALASCGDSGPGEVFFPDASQVDAVAPSRTGGHLLFEMVDDNSASAQARFWSGWTGNDDPLDLGMASGLCQAEADVPGTDNTIEYEDVGDQITVLHEAGTIGMSRTQFAGEIAYHAVPAVALVGLRSDRTYSFEGVSGTLPEYMTLSVPTGWPTLSLPATGSTSFTWSDDSNVDVITLVFRGDLNTLVCSYPRGTPAMIESAVLSAAGQSGTIELRASRRTSATGTLGNLVFLGTSVALGSYALL